VGILSLLSCKNVSEEGASLEDICHLKIVSDPPSNMKDLRVEK
jgi:hypothetical protein